MTHSVALTNIIFLLLLYSNCSPTSRLIKVAVNISSTYYVPFFITTVIWKQNKSDCVNEFIKDYPGSVVVSPWYDGNDNQIRKINETVGFKQTIYFATTLQEFSEFMKLINTIRRFPIRFILVLENTINNASELSAFNEVAWKNDQVNLVIISTNDVTEIKLSTYFPYSHGLCGNYTPVFLEFGDNMFPKKLTNFHRCPINITLLQVMSYVIIKTINGNITSFGGHDGEMLMIILNKLNASVKIASVDKHSTFGTHVNGIATGSIRDLVTGVADILIPAGILTQNRYSVTTPSHIYYTVDIRWIGPKQREVYDWLKVVAPDRTNFTPLHGLAFASFIIVAMLIRRCKPHLIHGNNHILYQSFNILLGQSANFITKSSLLNAMFLLWIWLCFIFRIDYQADLFDALQDVTLEPPLGSVEEAIEKLDGYGGPEVYREYYNETPLKQNYKIITVPELKRYIKRVFEGDKFLLATDVKYISKLNNHVQMLNKRISSTGACIYMRPGWPATNDVDDIIVKLTETGFVEKLLSNTDKRWLFDIAFASNDELQVKGLNMKTFSTCFYGLALMWAICTTIFFIEIVYHKTTSKKIYPWIE